MCLHVIVIAGYEWRNESLLQLFQKKTNGPELKDAYDQRGTQANLEEEGVQTMSVCAEIWLVASS